MHLEHFTLPRLLARRFSYARATHPVRALQRGALNRAAESLAAAQRIAPKLKRGRPLVQRLHDNSRVLTEAYRTIVKATHALQSISPGAEWLLDNFHVVDEQVREIRGNLPPGFSGNFQS